MDDRDVASGEMSFGSILARELFHHRYQYTVVQSFWFHNTVLLWNTKPLFHHSRWKYKPAIDVKTTYMALRMMGDYKFHDACVSVTLIVVNIRIFIICYLHLLGSIKCMFQYHSFLPRAQDISRWICSGRRIEPLQFRFSGTSIRLPTHHQKSSYIKRNPEPEKNARK